LLSSYPDIGSVTSWDARASTPTLTDLSIYDVVITWNNYQYVDPVALGNVLADYVDNGGKVIESVFVWYSATELGGRFRSGGYEPFVSTGAGNHFAFANLGTRDAVHPIMAGVTAASDRYRDYTNLASGAYLVASWTDGEEFVATKGNVVAINSFLGDGYQWTGDVGKIVHNSIVYLMTVGDVLWLSESPITGTLAISGSAGSAQQIMVTFDTSPITQTGQYFAALRIRQDTPYAVNSIPVTMTVVSTLNLTVNVVGNGTVSQNPLPPYLYGDVVTLTANAATGSDFAGWSGNLTGTTNPMTIT
jgi:hypothetical protein